MKRKLLLTALTGLLIFSFSCSTPGLMGVNPLEEQQTAGVGVQLTISKDTMRSSAGSRTADINLARNVLVSATDSAGKTILNKKSIKLYNLNGHFVTGTLPLTPGSYQLTEFLVTDADNKVLFATPLTGSNRAHLVQKPLPINFTVTKDSLSNVDVEVLDATIYSAADLGYTTFSFKPIKTIPFLAIVQLSDKTMTSADITIEGDSAVIYKGKLEAVVNRLEVHDGYTTYRIVLNKPGYEYYSKEFSSTGLKEHFARPLLVSLKPDALGLAEIQLLPTNAAHDVKTVIINNEHYLFIANNSTYSSNLYKWNGTAFSLIQSLSGINYGNCDFITINGVTYLALTSFSGSSSTIFRWNGSNFVELQSLPTVKAAACELFTIANDFYLAIAQQGSNSNSKVYKWNGALFTEVQSIHTLGAADCHAFTIDNENYLAIANFTDGMSEDIHSEILKWDGTAFVSVQRIPSRGAYDWESFTINGETYLALANLNNHDGQACDSKIFKWNGTSFIEFQLVSNMKVAKWKSFEINGETYLAAANLHLSYIYKVNSKIFKWNGTSFAEVESVPTAGAIAWESFTINGESYLAVANMYDGSSYATNSKIYKWGAAAVK